MKFGGLSMIKEEAKYFYLFYRLLQKERLLNVELSQAA